MRSLYWKIFLWFWLATVLMVVVTAWATREVAELTGAQPPRWRIAGAAAQVMHEAAITLQRDGLTGLRARLPLLEMRARTRLFIVGREQRDVLGRVLSPAARDALQHAGRAPPEGVLMAAAHGPQGRPYLLIAVLPSPQLAAARAAARQAGAPRPHGLHALELIISHLLWGHAPAPVMWTRLAVAVAVSGLVCLLLARWFTGPLRRLRDTSNMLAAGDLSARVGPALSARRDELGELGRAFDGMATRVDALVAAQRRLLGDVSHELRTPLARLMIALGLARQRMADASPRELDRIELEVERLDELIGRILTLQRLDQQPEQQALEPVDLAALVGEVAEDATFEAGAVGEAPVMRVDSSAGGTVQGDPDLLRSALENVVRNALRHAPPGSAVELGVHAQPGDPRRRVVRVRDHGPGVREQDLPHLFEPFFRVEDARDRDSGGHGLGLAITERAVRRHGGTVRASNAPGGGLLVEVCLPVATEAATSGTVTGP